jgi:osmoprotectant transport system substrate-binding protein
MRKVHVKLARLLGLAIVLATGAVGCGGGGGGAAGKADLSDAEFTVGSKEFTEQKILGRMAILILQDKGAEVRDETGLVIRPT